MQCPYCDWPDCEPVNEPDEDGMVEYRCLDCGEYFVAACEDDDEPPDIPRATIAPDTPGSSRR